MFVRRLKRRVNRAATSVAHSYDYAKHFVKGEQADANVHNVISDEPPVVLVHGFLGTRGTMGPLMKRLANDGRVPFSYGYKRFQLGSLRESAQGLVEQLRTISQSTNCGPVDIVGFSMGGLVAMYAIKFLGGDRYCRSLTLMGTPVNGTWLSLAGIAALGALSSSVWQTLPFAQFVRELEQAPMPEHIQIAQIQAKGDSICPRAERLKYVMSENYSVLPGGHASLLVAKSFYQRLSEFLAKQTHASDEVATDLHVLANRSNTKSKSENTGTSAL